MFVCIHDSTYAKYLFHQYDYETFYASYYTTIFGAGVKNNSKIAKHSKGYSSLGKVTSPVNLVGFTIYETPTTAAPVLTTPQIIPSPEKMISLAIVYLKSTS